MAMTKKAEDDLVYLAFLHAEQDVAGLVEAYHRDPKGRKPWERLLKRLRDYRKKRFANRTSLWDYLATLTPTPLEQITGGPDREFRSP